MTLNSCSIESFSIFNKVGKFYAIGWIKVSDTWIDTKFTCLDGIELFIRSLDHTFRTIPRNSENITFSINSDFKVLIAHTSDFHNLCLRYVFIFKNVLEVASQVFFIKWIFSSPEFTINLILKFLKIFPAIDIAPFKIF
ncbi:hypothetical protein IMSAG025_00686 [Muribaculaceae bacterium]|nr:hypothetical protein IMSAG025_00686 [Muribaculaceae bacterium]